MSKKIRAIGALVLTLVWAALIALAWFSPAKQFSQSERRELFQFPDTSGKTILSGKFMTDFEKYTLDQFPGRDTFRSIKAMFHSYGLLQQDNNDIYLADGYLAKQDYPLAENELTAATNRISKIYETYFKESGSRVFCAVIPDKGYYLSDQSGHLAMDYDKLFSHMETALPFATHNDLTDTLNIENYYYTDTHWRQETLFPTAAAICKALDMPAPEKADFTATEATEEFYGVYHGQAALPLAPETLYLMESERVKQMQVSIHNGVRFTPMEYTGVYDLEKLTGKEPYDVFLSGPQSILRIENPNASTDKELIIFRDSFGSSIAPLLVSEYKTVTLVDTRYLNSQMLGRFLEFNGQDVLFMYSTLVLNTGSMIK